MIEGIAVVEGGLFLLGAIGVLMWDASEAPKEAPKVLPLQNSQ